MTSEVNATDEVSMLDIVFADDFSSERTIAFMAHWVPTSVKITAGYLFAVYFGQKMMRNRAAFELDYPLALWNFVFSIFSAVAAYKLIPELIWAVRSLGFIGSYCNSATYYTDPSTGYWGWMFAISKTAELGDTLFLVLRKRPVIFVHWYHHALTFIYAQVTYSETQAWCRWSLALNLSVHTIMYCYFGVRALHVKTPRPVAQFITTIQIVQFVINCYIFGHLFYIKYYDTVPDCQVAWNVLTLGGFMYVSYLYLFADFFYHAYIVRKPRGARLEGEAAAGDAASKTYLPASGPATPSTSTSSKKVD